MLNILITTSSFGEQSPELLETMSSAGLNPIQNPYKRKLSESEADYLIQEYNPIAIIAGVEPLTRYVMERAPFLKVISRCGIGLDTVDLPAAGELGVVVTNTPDAPTIPVAELTIGLILSLLRAIHVTDNSIRSGGWERPMGSLLYGKTVGIIGCGRIGSYVGKLLSSFGCNLLGYDPYSAPREIKEASSIEKLLEAADIVLLHLPHTKDNHHIINTERLTHMKQGAMLVNTSRGGLVDETALFEALKSGRLSGAAFDCFEQEPYAGPLAQLQNTLLTSHIGSYAREGRILMERQAVDNLLKALTDLRLLV
jgi:D-3-phosphoglycerate dehydrogenase / 2-oxoglutarate reductase